MSPLRTFLALLAVATLVLGGARADNCTEEADLTISLPTGETYYIMDDSCLQDCRAVSFWVYQESNGQPGLQRCGWESELPECCDGLYEADTVVI